MGGYYVISRFIWVSLETGPEPGLCAGHVRERGSCEWRACPKEMETGEGEGGVNGAFPDTTVWWP